MKQFYRRRFFRIAPLFYAMLCVYIVLLGFDVSPVKVLTSVTISLYLFPSQVEGIVWASWVDRGGDAVLRGHATTRAPGANIRQAVALFGATVLIAAVWHEAFKRASGTSEDFG